MTKHTQTKNLPATQAAGGLPVTEELAALMAGDAGMGVSTSAAEVGIPFLYILQDNSPQVKKREEAYVEGAEPGDIYNNVTREVIKGDLGFEFIPVFFEAAQVEWLPNRGGFVAKHAHDTPLLGKVKIVESPDGKKIPTLPNNNVLTETKYHYGFYRPRVAEGEEPRMWEPCIMGMASTMIGCSREFEGMKKRVLIPNSSAVAPAFAKVYIFTTKVKRKAENSWFIWDIAQDRWVSGEEYAAAKALSIQCAEGALKVSDPSSEAASGGASGEVDEEVL